MAASSDQKEPVSNATTTFFDLPPELRLEIYEYLLPWRKSLVWGCSIAFIRTNRQIHEEACEAFYGSAEPFDITIHGWSTAHPIGYVSFLTQTVDLDDVPRAACFGLLKRIRSLRLRIKAFNNERAICEARDALGALLRRLDPDHHLETLDVTVDITRPAPQTPVIKPQDLSPAVLMAFVTAPLGMIRRNAEVATRLTVSGDESQPLPAMTEHYQAAITINGTVSSASGFSRCFVHLRRLFRVANSLPNATGLDGCGDDLRLLCRARILEDVSRFRISHLALAKKMEKLASANLQASLASAQVGADRTQLMQNLLALQEAVAEIESEGSTGGKEEEGFEEASSKEWEAARAVKKRRCVWPDLVGGRKKVRVVNLDDSSGSETEEDAY
ncbi:hypothetical protein LTR36_000852 [Oleoguttula mirabilis]|uniref:Uncharacterized protein n=1 Tax=Oleoguttula mirabilis TaxID=1507867 RepID=A0AAV9J3W6_9PEZI|nr:hypothetical protein LTR36_000852 [Oleoguttula mirabilis]